MGQLKRKESWLLSTLIPPSLEARAELGFLVIDAAGMGLLEANG
jgi:hypothetical protein